MLVEGVYAVWPSRVRGGRQDVLLFDDHDDIGCVTSSSSFCVVAEYKLYFLMMKVKYNQAHVWMVLPPIASKVFSTYPLSLSVSVWMLTCGQSDRSWVMERD